MQHLGKHLLRKKWIILMCFIFSFCFGYLVGNIYNHFASYYQCEFKIADNINFDYSLLNNEDFLNEIKLSGLNKETNVNKYENINVKKLLDNNDFKIIDKGNNNYVIETPYKYYDVFFVNSSMKLSNRAKTFIRDAIYQIADKDNVTFSNPNDIVEIKNDINPIIVSIGTSLIGTVATFAIITLIFFKKIEKEDIFIYDNINTYRTIFHRSYWIDAAKSVRKTKDITTISLIFALILLCKYIPLPSGFGDLGLSFTYLFIALAGLIYGPIYGFFIGTMSDVLGFFINSSGYFFWGYTLQAALCGMIYGLFFYKTKVNFSKVLMCRLIINIFMNALWGSMCYTIVFTTFPAFSSQFNEFLFTYASILSLPKNIIYLVPQSLFLFYFIKVVSPILFRQKLINKTVYEHIRIFK